MIPDIDKNLVVVVELLVGLVRRTDNDDIRTADELFGPNEALVDDELIGAENFVGLDEEDFAQFVGKRLAWIIAFALEGHAEDADRHFGKVMLSLETGEKKVRQTFVDEHGA